MAQTQHPSNAAETLHASAVALGRRGLLITGKAGAGKTTLLCELIALGADLVADDRVAVTPGHDAPLLSPAQGLAGIVELRGAGILRLAYRTAVPLWLIADLDATPEERMPPARSRLLCGHSCPVMLCREVRGTAARLIVALRAEAPPDPLWAPDR